MDIFRSNHLHTKPSNFSLGHLVRTQCKIRRFCMETIGPKNAHISAANCSKQLIFGDWAFFIMLFPNMQLHCIISQIHLFVTSHFTTLLNFSCFTKAIILLIRIWLRIDCLPGQLQLFVQQLTAAHHEQFVCLFI